MLLAVNYFRKNAPFLMFDKVLNTPLLKVKISFQPKSTEISKIMPGLSRTLVHAIYLQFFFFKAPNMFFILLLFAIWAPSLVFSFWNKSIVKSLRSYFFEKYFSSFSFPCFRRFQLSRIQFTFQNQVIK